MGIRKQKSLNRYPKVGVVILNWNNYKDTKECLESIEQLTYKNYKLVVVDGKSSDSSTKKIQKERPQHKYIYLNEDKGYSGGNNVGIKYLVDKGADYILSLNNDVVLTPNTLCLLVEEIKNNRKAGMVGPKIYSYYDRLLFQLHGSKVNLFLSKPISKWVREDENGGYPNNPYFDEKLPGACLLIKKEALDGVGLMDEKFFLYYADTDWEKRFMDEGWLLISVPKAKAYHKISSTTSQFTAKMSYYEARDFLHFVKKHYNLAILVYCAINSFLRKISAAFLDLISERDFRKIGYITLGYLHFILNKSGKVL